MDLTMKKGMMIDTIRNYEQRLTKESESCHRYFAPDVPDNIMEKLIKYFDNHLAVHNMLAYFDTTWFNTSKMGFLFMTDGFYYRYVGKADYFRYKDLSLISFNSEKKEMDLYLVNCTEKEYHISEALDMQVMTNMLQELRKWDEYFGQSSLKESGKVKKMDLPQDMQDKCSVIIHGAAAGCGVVGAGFAQLPCSDAAIITPSQIGMIVALGRVFDLNITEAAAKSIISSVAGAVAGRTLSQILGGWIPGLGNVFNAATASGLTEAIGWIAVEHFYNRWIEDKNKGRLDGMKDGYVEASEEYQDKLKRQADEFLKQKKNVAQAFSEYEALIKAYEEYIDKLERERAEQAKIDEAKQIYSNLKDLNN